MLLSKQNTTQAALLRLAVDERSTSPQKIGLQKLFDTHRPVSRKHVFDKKILVSNYLILVQN